MDASGVELTAYASEPRLEVVAEAELTLGVGPSVETYARGLPVLEPDLGDDPPARWLGVTRVMLDSGIRGVSCFPLGTGPARIGTLSWFGNEPDQLGDGRLRDAPVLAAALTDMIVSLHARRGRGPHWFPAADFLHREVHQAAGMVSVQLDLDVDAALVRLRAWAFANDVALSDAAARVISGRLRLER